MRAPTDWMREGPGSVGGMRGTASVARAAQPALAAHYFRVRELVAYIRDLFATDPILPDVWVSGEISELTHSAAGHVYFTLRDGDSRIPAVMFRTAVRRQTLPVVAGHSALVHGSVGIYDQRSIFQLVADVVLPGDTGLLRAQFEALRIKLEQEGLFTRKRPLPRIPQRIGLVTSETGAVLQDMLKVWQRRFRAIELVLAPAAMQGEDAPRQVVAALRRLNEFHLVVGALDVIIVARGGGSPDELAAFNDERVARAIFASMVPVVSAIGHEVDVTIADYAADVRAPTPSAAAEVVAPDAAELRREIQQMVDRMRNALRRQLVMAREAVVSGSQRLERHAPLQLMVERRRAVDELAGRGTRAIRAVVGLAQSRVEAARAQVAALSPETTLARGYAICSRPEDGSVLTDAAQLNRGDRLAVRFARGRVVGEVLEREEATSDSPREKANVD